MKGTKVEAMGAREEAQARERVGKGRGMKGISKAERKEQSRGEVKSKGASANGGRGRE